MDSRKVELVLLILGSNSNQGCRLVKIGFNRLTLDERGGTHVCLRVCLLNCSESDFLNEKLRQAKQQELVSRRYILDFTWDDILEIGCNVEHKGALVEILTETFTISTEEASSKINERSSSPEQNRTAT